MCSDNQFLGPLLRSEAVSSAVEISTTLCLAWVRDMKVVHPLAKWSWEYLKHAYKKHDLVKEVRQSGIEVK